MQHNGNGRRAPHVRSLLPPSTPIVSVGLTRMLLFQGVKHVLSVSERETSKQNNVEKFEIREQNKNKTEAKWKYKVRSTCGENRPDRSLLIQVLPRKWKGSGVIPVHIHVEPAHSSRYISSDPGLTRGLHQLLHSAVVGRTGVRRCFVSHEPRCKRSSEMERQPCVMLHIDMLHQAHGGGLQTSTLLIRRAPTVTSSS